MPTFTIFGTVLLTWKTVVDAETEDAAVDRAIQKAWDGNTEILETLDVPNVDEVRKGDG